MTPPWRLLLLAIAAVAVVVVVTLASLAILGAHKSHATNPWSLTVPTSPCTGPGVSRVFDYGVHVWGNWTTQRVAPGIVGYWFNISDASGLLQSGYTGGSPEGGGFEFLSFGGDYTFTGCVVPQAVGYPITITGMWS